MKSLLIDARKLAVALSSTVFIFEKDEVTQLVAESEDTLDNHITALAFNSDCSLLVVAYNDKWLRVWDVTQVRSDLQPVCVSHHRMPKKLTSLIVAPVPGNHAKSLEAAIVGDKAGDVYALCLPLLSSPVLLLGHTASIITSLAMLTQSTGGDVSWQLVSADRDEKIRVTAWPQTSQINAFCLGHTAFVSSVAVLSQSPERLVSIGGDGTLRVWDPINGHELFIEPIIEEEGACTMKATTCLDDGEASSSVASCMAVLRSPTFIAVGVVSRPQLLLWGFDSASEPPLKRITPITLPGEARAVEFCEASNKLFALCDAPHLLLGWELHDDGFMPMTCAPTLRWLSKLSSIQADLDLQVLSALPVDDASEEPTNSKVTSEKHQQGQLRKRKEHTEKSWNKKPKQNPVHSEKPAL